MLLRRAHFSLASDSQGGGLGWLMLSPQPLIPELWCAQLHSHRLRAEVLAAPCAPNVPKF